MYGKLVVWNLASLLNWQWITVKLRRKENDEFHQHSKLSATGISRVVVEMYACVIEVEFAWNYLVN